MVTVAVERDRFGGSSAWPSGWWSWVEQCASPGGFPDPPVELERPDTDAAGGHCRELDHVTSLARALCSQRLHDRRSRGHHRLTHAGGELVAAGTPEEVAQVEESYTGRFLRVVLPSQLPPPEPNAARGRVA